ncbi:MAG: hypothetical protein LWW86_07705 [Micrococcales bacterium]|nr:hypothetical protein [Micrococcales bacterium]
MSVQFGLSRGSFGPQQQTAVSCGAACLTVARMLVDPAFATWVATGEGAAPVQGELPSPTTRFAAYEALVHKRTTSMYAAGQGLSMPWPRALGTPPWGAKRELELGAARLGATYAIEALRPDSQGQLAVDYDRLVDVVADGEPALLYIGNALSPRHVVLVLPGDGDRILDVYEPVTGRVSMLRREAFAARRLGLAGWQVPWISVQPARERASRAPALRTQLRPAEGLGGAEAGLARVADG